MAARLDDRVKLAMRLAVFWATGTLEPMAMVTITTWFSLGPALAIAADRDESRPYIVMAPSTG